MYNCRGTAGSSWFTTNEGHTNTRPRIWGGSVMLRGWITSVCLPRQILYSQLCEGKRNQGRDAKILWKETRRSWIWPGIPGSFKRRIELHGGIWSISPKWNSHCRLDRLLWWWWWRWWWWATLTHSGGQHWVFPKPGPIAANPCFSLLHFLRGY